MKSIIINGPRSFSMVERPRPQVTPGRVILKTKYAAICGSDGRFWNSDAYTGLCPGHEFSGYIEDPGDFPFRKGQRVCAAEFDPCGTCEFCRSGREQLCPHMMRNNPGVSMDGAFGEYLSVRGDFVHILPDDVPMQLGAITEPVAVALHGVRYCGLQPGEAVLIWGNGPIGIYAAACAKLLGAGKVYLTGRSPGRVQFCKRFTFIDDCFSVRDADFDAQLRAVMPEGGFPNLIDCLGTDQLDVLARCAKRGASLVLLGMHAPQITISSMRLYLKELSIRTGLYFSAQDYADAFHLVCSHQELFLPTITATIPQDPEAVQSMFETLFASGSNSQCKVLLEYPD